MLRRRRRPRWASPHHTAHFFLAVFFFDAVFFAAAFLATTFFATAFFAAGAFFAGEAFFAGDAFFALGEALSAEAAADQLLSRGVTKAQRRNAA